MNAIKSLEDLKRIRQEALEKRKVKETSGSVQVIVGMGTCGIAAGARETMKSVLDFIEKNNVENVVVTQTGCIGICEQEPILQVAVGDGEKITYGKVNIDLAGKIMQSHVVDGKVLEENTIQI
jgi:NADP-reducing hydrogenase subunit HndB